MVNRKVEDPFEVVVKVTPILKITVSKRKLTKKVRAKKVVVRRKRRGRPPATES